MEKSVSSDSAASRVLSRALSAVFISTLPFIEYESKSMGPRYTSEVMSSEYQERITIDPAKRGGKPCIRDLRMTVYDVLEFLASGMTERDILQDFPDLEPEDIRACLSFAADRERKLVNTITFSDSNRTKPELFSRSVDPARSGS